jgi:hypothetical protein
MLLRVRGESCDSDHPNGLALDLRWRNRFPLALGGQLVASLSLCEHAVQAHSAHAAREIAVADIKPKVGIAFTSHA